MKPTFKGIVLGATTGVLTLAATAALAGTGIGGVFNLGVDNTVDGQTQLRGNTGGNPQLRVNNQQGTDGAIKGARRPLGRCRRRGRRAGRVGLDRRERERRLWTDDLRQRRRRLGRGQGDQQRRLWRLRNSSELDRDRRRRVRIDQFDHQQLGRRQGRRRLVRLLSAYGVSPTNGIGVRGEVPAGANTGWGVEGLGSDNGIGVRGKAGNALARASPVSAETAASSRPPSRTAPASSAPSPARAMSPRRGRERRDGRQRCSGGNGGWFSSIVSNGTGVVGTVTGAGHGVRGEAGAGGVAVYGKNLGGGYAFGALGNAGQSRTAGGWVKAMAYVDPGRPAGQQVVRCFNSQVWARRIAASPPDGFQLGRWYINFGFQVSDRFVMVTAQDDGVHFRAIVANAIAVNAFAIEVRLNYADNDTFTNVPFWLIVF